MTDFSGKQCDRKKIEGLIIHLHASWVLVASYLMAGLSMVWMSLCFQAELPVHETAVKTVWGHGAADLGFS